MNNPFPTSSSSEWFKDWFDSKYYHQLYDNRDHQEADRFITKLTAYLNLPPHAFVWDLACGKGRHSVKLNDLGFNVTGTDLSVNSITEANKFTNANLDFFVHDMRTPFRINYFDVVFNLFTSIGYFDNRQDNYRVFETVTNSLKPGGLFVLDFFNANKVKNDMVPFVEVQKCELKFMISKEIKDGKVIKRIEFNADNAPRFFEEKVCLFEKSDFMEFANHANLKLKACFGDYQLNEFNSETSDRLILIFSK